MKELHIGIIGIVAGVLTTSSFIPQIVKIVKTRQVRDLSLVMFVFFTIGIFLWLIYGIFIGELPIILANSTGLVLSSYILYAKLFFDKKGK